MTADAELSALWTTTIGAHLSTVDAARQTLEQDYQDMVALSVDALRTGHRLFFCGNGGSAADAQHLAAELTVRLVGDRPALPALALATDSAALTACGNDFGFERVFARQIEAHATAGDVLFAISTSGRSPNVLRAIEEARNRSVHTVLLTGASADRSCADITISVPSTVVARIQEAHILIGHLLCSGIELRMGMGSDDPA